TRAFYFVRSVGHRSQGNSAAEEEDVKRFKATAAQTAWDYFLPGHSAGWAGDVEEAIRSHRAALTLQPNHYPSPFFPSEPFNTGTTNRRPEALWLYTACIALRPDHVLPYLNHAGCHEKLGQMDEAETDYTAAINVAADEKERIAAYDHRCRFYHRLGC